MSSGGGGNFGLHPARCIRISGLKNISPSGQSEHSSHSIVANSRAKNTLQPLHYDIYFFHTYSDRICVCHINYVNIWHHGIRRAQYSDNVLESMLDGHSWGHICICTT